MVDSGLALEDGESAAPLAETWQVLPTVEVPPWLLQTIQDYLQVLGVQGTPGQRVAQLLWQRGMQDPEQIKGFLNPALYQPATPFAFGAEMNQAVARLQQAYQAQEKVAIWGDFDADGVTSTAVLWEGLGQFFRQDDQLTYFIPNRLTESHGLAVPGLERLAAQGCRLIVTCDTGSTNLRELAYAQELGVDVIVTDHHTLPIERPPVVAIVNPRHLPPTHPLAHLSGVAVAYKLVEALYQTLPAVPQQPLEDLLDLVAIGLIADLVQLSGDCRYLAQQGLRQLQKQSNPKTTNRPGVAELLRLCKRSGDRPTDISFGLGPRINAVSRIHGDAHFCVELLTSRDPKRCRELAEATELANARRKALQRDVTYQVKQKLRQLDLSTTQVIVLMDSQWPVGVLGIVAGQIAQEYGRPTVLLSVETAGLDLSDPAAGALMARGSARSVGQIDLYQLVEQQSHLLQSFGGHPLAAGLSLKLENLELFTTGINRQLRQQSSLGPAAPVCRADLTVTVAELGEALFRELRLLEPYGMGNPLPYLLIRNCWFTQVGQRNLKDLRGQKLRYIKTEFRLCDETRPQGIAGVWWEHYKEDLPQGRCDAIADLDYNTTEGQYSVRLIAVRPSTDVLGTPAVGVEWLEDWRDRSPLPNDPTILVITRCPTSWAELRRWFRRAKLEGRGLAIAYPPPRTVPPAQVWQTLVGIAKYLSRTGATVTRLQLYDKLAVSDRTLQLGFRALQTAGFQVSAVEGGFQVQGHLGEGAIAPEGLAEQVAAFLAAVQEDQFRQQYFAAVSCNILQAMAAQP